jgi:uncharacterized membrane protein HdeD (DUF308 family)
MILKTLFRNWWVILIQGILMIGLSIIVFNHPGAVIATVAAWLGIIVLVSGIIGAVPWFMNAKENRDSTSLLGSVVMILVGILMLTKIVATIKAITLIFGLLVAIIGLALVSGGWNNKKHWSLWWLIALLGVITLVIGVKSIMDMYEGAENIITLMGIAILISGIGLICLAFLKKNVAGKIQKNNDK